MLEIVIAITGMIVGAASVYFAFIRTLREDARIARKERDLIFRCATDVYNAAFSPYGMHPQIFSDYCDALWMAIGKEPKGTPK